MHFVDEELDHGPIILQKAVPVLDTDFIFTAYAAELGFLGAVVSGVWLLVSIVRSGRHE